MIVMIRYKSMAKLFDIDMNDADTICASFEVVIYVFYSLAKSILLTEQCSASVCLC